MAIKTCTCEHKVKDGVVSQDTLYGKQKRVMNQIVTKDKSTVYRCTICGKETK